MKHAFITVFINASSRRLRGVDNELLFITTVGVGTKHLDCVERYLDSNGVFATTSEEITVEDPQDTLEVVYG